jgi:transketolase
LPLLCVLISAQIRTVIGHGSGKAGSHGVHGAPLGAADLKAVKAKFGFNPEEVS